MSLCLGQGTVVLWFVDIFLITVGNISSSRCHTSYEQVLYPGGDMGCFQRCAPRATPVEHQTERVVEPAVPVVDAASIRKSVASLVRDKSDAGKVLDTISASTPTTSLGYERAHTLTYEHGLERKFANGQVIHDYYRDVKGDLHLDFSKTQDASYHTEQVVHQTRGPLGRVRQHVVQTNVQTLRSEKVRLDCDLSPKLAIDLGQSDTVFVNAACQKGDKQIAFSQKDGGGTLGLVIGKEQRLAGVTFDATKQTATITTDKGTITITGIVNPNDVRIGREKGTGQSPAFVAIDAVASMSREGRAENLKADTAQVQQLFKQGEAIASQVKNEVDGLAKKILSYASTMAQKPHEPLVEELSPDRVVTPAPPPAPSPSDRKVEPLKPETLARVEELIAKNAAVAKDLAARLERSQAEQQAIAERIAKETERIAFAELKQNVNQILESRGETPARGAEISASRDALHLDPSKNSPTAEEIATSLVDARLAARAQVEKTVRDSMHTISSESGLEKTKAWADKNIALFGTLNSDGKKAFIDLIKRDWKYGAERESFDPQEFFDNRLAFVASMEIRSATRSVTTYMPPSSRPGPLTPVTHSVPDIAQISAVVRSLQDKAHVLALLAETPVFKETRGKLPTKGIFVTEPGLEQRSLDARMKGETELADALLVRSLINARRVFTKEDRKQIADAIGVDSDRKERINKIYQENYGADIRDDLKTLNKAAIERAERTRKDLAEQERKAREAREAVGDLLD